MIDATQAAWTERINILNSVGVGMPARAELAGLGVEPDRLRTVVRAAYGRGLRGAEIVEAIRSMLDDRTATTPAPGSPGGEVRDGPEAEEPSPESQGEAKADEPCESGSKTRRRAGADAENRANKTRTVQKGAKSMSAAHAKVKKAPDAPEPPRLRIAREETAPGPKLNGQAAGQSAKTDGVCPRLIDAKHAATMCGVSRSGWWKLHSSGRCPLPVRLARIIHASPY